MSTLDTNSQDFYIPSTNNLMTNNGARKKRMRVGRGGKKHKTCGRGGKGQTARSGVAINGFEGGQTPLHRRIPKRGFKNQGQTTYDVVNLVDLVFLVESQKITKDISLHDLRQLGYGKGRNQTRSKIKVLASLDTDSLPVALNIEAHAASAKAIQLIEAASGSFKLVAESQAHAQAQKIAASASETTPSASS